MDGDEKPIEAPVEETDKPGSDQILSVLTDEPQPEEKSEEKPEDKESADDKEETAEEEDKESEPEDKPESEQPADEDEDKKELDPEEAKKEEARKRYEEREKVRTERKQRVLEQTKEYVESAEDETDRRLRDMEVNQYNSIIENTENTLVNEFERVKTNPDLQIFNPDSKDFIPELYAKAMKDYNAGYINYDTNGNMVGLKGSLHQHLTETAGLYKKAIDSGAFKQVRDQKKMKNSADTKPAAPPKEPVKDPILDVLSSE